MSNNSQTKKSQILSPSMITLYIITNYSFPLPLASAPRRPWSHAREEPRRRGGPSSARLPWSGTRAHAREVRHRPAHPIPEAGEEEDACGSDGSPPAPLLCGSDTPPAPTPRSVAWRFSFAFGIRTDYKLACRVEFALLCENCATG
jgi:hypothetical protein